MFQFEKEIPLIPINFSTDFCQPILNLKTLTFMKKYASIQETSDYQIGHK